MWSELFCFLSDIHFSVISQLVRMLLNCSHYYIGLVFASEDCVRRSLDVKRTVLDYIQRSCVDST